MRDTFINPRNGEQYEWQVGHKSEEPTPKTRQISESANTNNTGLVKQQGDVQPLVLKYSGSILHKHQNQEFWRWYQLCETQTIFFRDFAGNEYEVIITDYAPKREPTIRNPKDFKNAPLWFWQYTLTMEVVRVISGELAGLTP